MITGRNLDLGFTASWIKTESKNKSKALYPNIQYLYSSKWVS